MKSHFPNVEASENWRETLVQGSDAEPIQAAAASLAISSRRLLVVDDDELIRQITVRALRGFGYGVDTAEDGAAAWRALQNRNYDLLLTDHNMPEVTGVELIHRIRSARMTLPVILMSGALPIQDLEPSLALAGVLLKPFSPAKLFVTVKTALSSHGDALQLSTVPASKRAPAHRGG